MSALGFFVLSLLAAPDEPVAPEPTAESDVTLEEAPSPSDQRSLGPLAIGLVLGEPTALRADFYVDEKTRAFGLFGMAHRIDAFSFAFDAPMVAAGIERDLLTLESMGTRSGALAVGLQADFWMRGFYTTSKPMMAMEIPISFRLASPSEPLSFYGTVAPGYYLAPGAGPSLSVSAGLSYRLPQPGARPATPEPAAAETAPPAVEEPTTEAKPEPKPAAKPKPKPKRKGRRRLSR